jgi:FkbM family methyltransferase
MRSRSLWSSGFHHGVAPAGIGYAACSGIVAAVRRDLLVSAFFRLPERLQQRLDKVVATGQTRWRQTYSTAGEDAVLQHLFRERRAPGHFVDVGAWHPWYSSNTFALYQQGWRGINIDAMPGSMVDFDRFRPGDMNIETAVGTDDGQATFYICDESSMHSLSADFAENLGAHVIEERTVTVRRLDSLLDDHPLPSFELLTIDVEGRDFDVLASNDWDRYRPSVVVVEADTCDSRSIDFLADVGYTEVARLPVVPSRVESVVLTSGVLASDS